MRQGKFRVKRNEQLAPFVYRMVLEGDVSEISSPGQFVNVKLEGKFLRRPISVCDRVVCDSDISDGGSEGLLTLVYKTVGAGTLQMSSLTPEMEVDVLTGLGNGYDLSKSGRRPLLIGGGVGIPPLFWLCRELIAQGRTPMVILGFNQAKEVFFESEFRDLGADVMVMTADGSYGNQGFVTDGMKLLEDEPEIDGGYTYIYTCGPMPMFRAINRIAKTSGQFSFEERMGCGFGACMGCSCKTITGYKRICKDGPVLEREEIIW